MKIGIVAISEGHYEYILTLLNILKKRNTQIILFLSKEISEGLIEYKAIDSNVVFFIKDTKDSISHFLKKNRLILNQLDLLFIDEIFSFQREWELPFIKNLKCQKILLLHSVNLWLKPHYSFNIKHLTKMLLRKNLLRYFDGISVISNNIKNYVQQHTNYKKDVFVAPFSFYSYENSLVGKKDQEYLINITIPGMINKNRRDYEMILNAYDCVIRNRFSIRLVLLGKPIGEYGKKILNICEDINRHGGNIEYFRNFISKEVFEKKIKEASILFADIPPKYYIEGTEEIYGLTKETGITFLAIKFAKPLILPKSFQNITELNKSIVNYENFNDLKNILTKLNHKMIEELTKQALINSQNFIIGKIRKASQIGKLTL